MGLHDLLVLVNDSPIIVSGVAVALVAGTVLGVRRLRRSKAKTCCSTGRK